MSYRWICNKNIDKTPALKIPGHRVRSYLASNGMYFKKSFVVNVYIGKTDIMQEIVCESCSEEHGQQFWFLRPDIFYTLFPDFKVTYLFSDLHPLYEQYYECVDIVTISDRILFKFKIEDWNRYLYGVNRNNIDMTFAGALLDRFGSILFIACKYPDKITCLDDVVEIKNSIIQLSGIVRNEYFDTNISHLRNLMSEKMNDISIWQKEYDNICNEAAEAMNVLEDRFGITVNLN